MRQRVTSSLFSCLFIALAVSVSAQVTSIPSAEPSVSLSGGAITGSSATKPKPKPTPTPSATPAPPKDPYWDINGSTAGSGASGVFGPSGHWDLVTANWNNTANGTGAVSAWVNGSDAVFSAGTDANGTTYTITVDGSIAANSITIEEGGINFFPGTTPSLTLGAGGITINSGVTSVNFFGGVPITLSASQSWVDNSTSSPSFGGTVNLGTNALIIGGTGTMSINGGISGSGGLTINGNLNLGGGSNSYSGATTIDGFLGLNAISGKPSSSSITVNSGGKLRLAVNSGTWGTIGAGSITLNGGTLENVGTGQVSTSNNISLASSSIISNTISNGTFTLSGTISETAPSALTLSGGTFGSTFVLSGQNTYTGGTTVSSPGFNSNTLALGSSSTVTSGVITSGPIGTGTLTLGFATTLRSDSTATRTIQNNVSMSSTINIGSSTAGLTGALIFNSAGLTTPSTVALTGDTTLTVASGGSLEIDNVINGASKLTKTGSNSTLILAAQNTFSGGFQWGSSNAGGIISLGASSVGSVTSGPFGTGTFTVTNTGAASTNFIQSTDSTTRTIANPITLSGSGILFNTAGTGDLLFSGTVNLGSNATRTFTINNTNTTFSNAISGSNSGITKVGTGTLILSGINNYSGGTTLSAGLLELKSTSALGSTSGALTVDGGILDLNGQSITVGALSGLGGTIWNNGPNAGSSTVTLTVGNGGGSGSYAGVITDNNGAAPLAKVALTKTGSGTITLTGANTYTGATNVNGGALFINGNQSAATGAVTVSGSGTTLGGSGTIGGSVTISAGSTSNNNLSPGASGVGSVAKLSTGALTLNANTNLNIDITGAGGTANAGTLYDQVSVTGAVNLGLLTNASNLVVSASGLNQSNLGQAFFILANDGTDAITGTFAQTTITSGSDLFTIDYNADFATGALTGGNDVALVLTAVPEPSTWFAAALAAGVIGYTLRGRFSRLFAKS